MKIVNGDMADDTQWIIGIAVTLSLGWGTILIGGVNFSQEIEA